jgi:hypothetical protein
MERRNHPIVSDGMLSTAASSLILKCDCAEITFTGDLYFASPISGRVMGAVFLGAGTFCATVPQLPVEKENMMRGINADGAESVERRRIVQNQIGGC